MPSQPDPDTHTFVKSSMPPGFDTETVRVELEREIQRRLIDRFGDELWASMPSSESVRRAWLAGAVGFSPELAPRGLRVADEARRVLRLEHDVQLYRATDGESLACIALTEDGPVHIRVHDVFLARPDDAVLLFVIGHEMGHHVAHASLRLRGPDPRFVHRWFARGRRAGVREVAAAACRAAELTADRVGLLACQDLGAALRTFMILSGEEPEPALAGCEEAYLTRSHDRVKELLARRERGDGDTHPEYAVRAFALDAFGQSAPYRALTGRGAGTRSLAEIDRLLERLVGPWESADDEGLPDLPPSLMEQAEERLGALRGRAREVTASGLANLRRVSRDAIEGAARSLRVARGADGSCGDREREALEEGDAEADPDADDLEKRFADLERRASMSGFPGEGTSDGADDLERRFTALEQASAGGSSE